MVLDVLCAIGVVNFSVLTAKAFTKIVLTHYTRQNDASALRERPHIEPASPWVWQRAPVFQSKFSVLAKHLGGDAMCVVRRGDSAIKGQEQQHLLNLLWTAPVFERAV
jgi:hypothetical protein